jgi:hypothetical protein
MVTQLHINKERHTFHNCLHYSVHPLYLSGNPSRANIKSRTNESKHMWNRFPLVSMTEQNYNLSRWANNGGTFLIVLTRIATYSGFGCISSSTLMEWHELSGNSLPIYEGDNIAPTLQVSIQYCTAKSIGNQLDTTKLRRRQHCSHASGVYTVLHSQVYWKSTGHH